LNKVFSDAYYEEQIKGWYCFTGTGDDKVLIEKCAANGAAFYLILSSLVNIGFTTSQLIIIGKFSAVLNTVASGFATPLAVVFFYVCFFDNSVRMKPNSMSWLAVIGLIGVSSGFFMYNYFDKTKGVSKEAKKAMAGSKVVKEICPSDGEQGGGPKRDLMFNASEGAAPATNDDETDSDDESDFDEGVAVDHTNSHVAPGEAGKLLP